MTLAGSAVPRAFLSVVFLDISTVLFRVWLARGRCSRPPPGAAAHTSRLAPRRRSSCRGRAPRRVVSMGRGGGVLPYAGVYSEPGLSVFPAARAGPASGQRQPCPPTSSSYVKSHPPRPIPCEFLVAYAPSFRPSPRRPCNSWMLARLPVSVATPGPSCLHASPLVAPFLRLLPVHMYRCSRLLQSCQSCPSPRRPGQRPRRPWRVWEKGKKKQRLRRWGMRWPR